MWYPFTEVGNNFGHPFFADRIVFGFPGSVGFFDTRRMGWVRLGGKFT